MSGGGWCAGGEGGAVSPRQSEFDDDCGWRSAKRGRQRQDRRLAADNGAGEMDEGADGAVVVGLPRSFVRCRLRNSVRGGQAEGTQQYRRMTRSWRPVEMHMPERQRELDAQRNQRQPRTQCRTRTEPMHGRYAQASRTAVQLRYWRCNNVAIRLDAIPSRL